MDSDEFAWWVAYNELEPFGDYRRDLQVAVVASTIANVNRGKRTQAFKPDEFMVARHPSDFIPKKPETVWDKVKAAFRVK